MSGTKAKPDFITWLRDQIWNHDEKDRVAEANIGSFKGHRWIEVVMHDGRRYIINVTQAGGVSSEQSKSSED